MSLKPICVFRCVLKDIIMAILKVKNLSTHFVTREGVVKAVDDVSFDLEKGETLGIVGESGCGKSVLALSIMRLIPEPPGRIVSGEVLFSETENKSTNLLKLSGKDIRKIRGKKIAMVFQEPMTSLNPVYTIGDQIGEVITLHEKVSKKMVKNRVIEMLKRVGIPEPKDRLRDYPHQMSGGMRQRVMIAMALSCKPSILIADEPTTALDVTIQAQILELMKGLQEDFGMALILITHDLGVVAGMADRVAVMYAGRIVEMANVTEIYRNPGHPYTRGLLGSIPPLEKQHKGMRLATIPGQVPDLINMPPGCPFQERCARAGTSCRELMPTLDEVSSGHFVRCFYPG